MVECCGNALAMAANIIGNSLAIRFIMVIDLISLVV